MKLKDLFNPATLLGTTELFSSVYIPCETVFNCMDGRKI